jgi:hypothetical protein
MELTHAYLAAPGCCCVCGTVDTTIPIVDMQTRDRGFQRLNYRNYLCGNCALEAGSIVARAMGFTLVPTDDALGARELAEQASAAQVEVVELKLKIDHMRRAWESLERLDA